MKRAGGGRARFRGGMGLVEMEEVVAEGRYRCV